MQARTHTHTEGHLALASSQGSRGPSWSENVTLGQVRHGVPKIAYQSEEASKQTARTLLGAGSCSKQSPRRLRCSPKAAREHL